MDVIQYSSQILCEERCSSGENSNQYLLNNDYVHRFDVEGNRGFNCCACFFSSNNFSCCPSPPNPYQDACYDVQGLADFATSVGATLSAGYYTHKHPDHVGGRFGKYLIEGVKEMVDLKGMGVLGIHNDDVAQTVRGTVHRSSVCCISNWFTSMIILITLP